MVSELDRTSEDLTVFEAEQLVEGMSHADDLVNLVVEDEHHWAARNKAAEKLLKLWENGRQGGITLDHLAYVGNHAAEPHKTQANDIIRHHL